MPPAPPQPLSQGPDLPRAVLGVGGGKTPIPWRKEITLESTAVSMCGFADTRRAAAQVQLYI